MPSLLLAVFCLGGILQAVTQYPFQVPDERLHWLAAVERVNQVTPFVPTQRDRLFALPNAFESRRLHHRRELKNRPGTFDEALYVKESSPDGKMNYGMVLSYPGAFVALLARRILPLSPISVLYLSRILSGLFVAAVLGWLLFIAVREGGFWKRLWSVGIALLMLSPIAIQQSFGVSVDPLIFAFALFVVGLLWKRAVGQTEMLVYFALSAVTVITKPPLLAWTVPLGVWLAANSKFGKAPRGSSLPPSRTLFWLGTALTFLIVVIMSAWSVSVTVPLERANPALQLAHVLAHPVDGLVALLRGSRRVLTTPGLLSNELGYLDFGSTRQALRLQQIAQALALLLFALPWFLGWRSMHVRKRPWPRKIAAADLLLLIGSAVSILGIAFFLYLYWTAPYATSVEGMQIRYVLPHFILFAGIAGARLDAVLPVEMKRSPTASLVTNVLLATLCFVFLAYFCERTTMTFARYF